MPSRSARVRATFRIRNDSDIELTDDNWALYWSMAPREVDQASITAPVTIEWISGDFYRMQPADGFLLPPGGEITITYRGGWAVIKESDAPVGLYMVLESADGSDQPYPIENYVILPFEGPEQINRGPDDLELKPGYPPAKPLNKTAAVTCLTPHRPQP